MLKTIFPDSFLIIIMATVGAASWFPPGPEVAHWVGVASKVAIFFLFFFHGAKISPAAVRDALVHWRLHSIIMLFTFVAFPLFAWAGYVWMSDLLSAPLWAGVIFMCALPSTVQSSIAFTSLARGNIAGAIAAASLSQVLGVFFTPFLVGALLGKAGTTVDASALGGVALQILLPFVLGQIARVWIGGWVNRHKGTIFYTDRLTILLSIFSAFSAAVREGIWHRVSVDQVIILTALCLGLLLFMLSATFAVGRFGGFSREDRIALQFCATKKSLVQGVPMARILFPGAAAGVALLPIMIFHQMQLMACAWIAAHYAKEPENV